MIQKKDDETKIEFIDMNEPVIEGMQTSVKILHGKLIPPAQQILLYSADEWERFIEEWVHYQKGKYHKVTRFAGANDMGVDVAAFVEDIGLDGAWDNYQCKHYKAPLSPQTGLSEVGKIIWHIYKKHVTCPRKYYFLAPKDCGMSFKKMLQETDKLKDKLIEKWDAWCSKSITTKEKIELIGGFKQFVDDFDYGIFTFKTALEVIDEHRDTPYFLVRFGGGLPDRPTVELPPSKPEVHESRYVEQLFEAYTDHVNENVEDLEGLDKWTKLEEHYHRQRECFYSAESLRNFARDAVPPGTFDELQDEVCEAVIDIESDEYADAFKRLNAVTNAAAQLPLTVNCLVTATKVQDKKGICHQLANENKLIWKKK